MLDFDYAFQPVAAGGTVYFGSSSHDTVRALDAATGRPRWSFAAGGPVRFAPHIAGGRRHFASDDGFADCLDAATGAEIWRVRVSATRRSVIANGRLSSRRPCRSGVLVRDGVVYVTAGMWPGEGVYVYALDAATGRELWCNDSTSHDYLAYPHEPSASFGGPAPQGYLLAGGDTLVAPTGRSCPAGFDARTGRILYYLPELASRGGTWAAIAGDALLFSAVGWQPDQSPRLGESPPHPGDSLSALDLRTGEEKWRLGASMKETAEEPRQPRRRGQIDVGLMGRQHAVRAGDRLYAVGDGRVDAYDVLEGSRVRRAWSVAHPRVYAEALTAGALLLGGQDSLTALDPADLLGEAAPVR